MTQTEIESAPAVERSAQSDPRARRRRAFMVPIVLVNLMALAGQAAWGYGEMVTGFLLGLTVLSVIAGVLLGTTLESISTWLMMQAHDATMEDQASGSLRFGAYAVSGVMAYLNYTHWSVFARELGYAFALLSMVSPYLWSVYSKRAHAAQLAARGIVDPRGVKLSSKRKILHPFKSFGVTRHAAWTGETNPSLAVSDWESTRSVERPALQGDIQIETADSPEIESADVLEIESDSQTETVTETVTETKTVKRERSVSREERREKVWRERLAKIESVHEDWREREITYTEIKAALGLNGVETVKGIYAALARERARVQIID